MFDRLMIESYPRSVDVRTNVTEQRAPTDESVRLLREMENAARARVVEAMRLPNNVIEAVAHRYDDYLSQQTKIQIHYKLNGKNRVCEFAVPIDTVIQDRFVECFKALGESIAEALSEGFIDTVAKGGKYAKNWAPKGSGDANV